MDKKRWFFSFLLAIAAILVVDYFFVHFLFPVKREAILQELKESVEEEILNNPYIPIPEPVPIPSQPDELPKPGEQTPEN